MESSQRQIGPLSKVALIIQSETDEFQVSDNTFFEFIFGVGSTGITPFEKALADRRVGDVITINHPENLTCSFFGHIPFPLKAGGTHRKAHEIRIRIESITEASPREVVAALAAATEWGHGGCGCGCG